ncbi:hypothetical protein [Streptosporangium saharense]|uniref:hypothetical protein n=1 Tax=Streptosporangium saharense TaxID=1706840 RepID=UPI00343186B5
MISVQTATESVAEGHGTTDDGVRQRQAGLLSELDRLLRGRGVRTSISHRGGPRSRGDELAVFSREGWEAATVTVGPRSGCFMVCLPVVGVDCQVMSGDRPDAVADVIVAVLPRKTREMPQPDMVEPECLAVRVAWTLIPGRETW